MSGFGGGGMGQQQQALQDQVAPQQPGGGPGEPNNMNYGQGGTYNTLAQDMSRNVFGPWGFNQGMFNYGGYGNPYQSQPPPGGPVTPPDGQPPGGQPGGPMDFDTWREQNPDSGWGGGLGSSLGSIFRYMGQQHNRGPFSGNYYQPGGGFGFQQTQGIPGGGRPSWPSYGYGGMTNGYGGYGGMGGGYGGMYGGGMHGSYGSPYARPWRGPSSAGSMGYGGGRAMW